MSPNVASSDSQTKNNNNNKYISLTTKYSENKIKKKSMRTEKHIIIAPMKFIKNTMPYRRDSIFASQIITSHRVCDYHRTQNKK